MLHWEIHNNNISPEIRKKISENYKKTLIKRLKAVSWVIFVSYCLYGFLSFSFIKEYVPEISLLDNVWPRLLFNALPFLGVIGMLSSRRFQPDTKINIFILMYGLCFFISSCVYVWPTALRNPEIMFYVGGANAAYICTTLTIISLSREYIPKMTLSVMFFILGPIFYVLSGSANKLIISTVVGDTVMAIAVGIMTGYLASKLFWQVEYLKVVQEEKAGAFLGERVQKAIFENKLELLEEKEVSAYIFFLDIRNSTDLTKKYGLQWESFNKRWISETMSIIHKYDGQFIKSMGDGVLGGFGIFDEIPDLSDIPGVEDEVGRSDEKRWAGLTEDLLGCMDEVYSRFQELAQYYFPTENLRLGGGIDRGKITRGVRGNSNKQEFDIWGDKVNVAAKLESLSKNVASDFHHTSSLLVLSPFASDFIVSSAKFRKVDLDEKYQIKSIKITWVLIKEYRNFVSQKNSQAA